MLKRKEKLLELFTKIPEFKNVQGLRREMLILRTSIIAEYDATNLYEYLAQITELESVRKVLLDVANEEKQHIGEFEYLLEEIDKEHEEYEDKGEEEVADMLGVEENYFKPFSRNFIQEDMSDIHSKIKHFFMQNPNPNDDQVHDFAERIGIDPDELENHIYMILTKLLQQKPMAGRHRNVPDSKYDPEELKMGIDVEMEHTDDPELAKQIAKDHLEELPDYYTRLKKMEGENH